MHSRSFPHLLNLMSVPFSSRMSLLKPNHSSPCRVFTINSYTVNVLYWFHTWSLKALLSYSGISRSDIQRPLPQIAATKPLIEILNSKKSNLITWIPAALHWLPVCYQIKLQSALPIIFYSVLNTTSKWLCTPPTGYTESTHAHWFPPMDWLSWTLGKKYMRWWQKPSWRLVTIASWVNFNLVQHVSSQTHDHGHTLNLVFTLGLVLNNVSMINLLISDH